MKTSEYAAVAAVHSVDPDRWWTEFSAVIDRIAPRFARYEPLRHASELMLGMVSGLDRKNCWTIAEHRGDATPDGLQHLLARAKWDADGVRDDLRDYVIDAFGDPGAMPDERYRLLGHQLFERKVPRTFQERPHSRPTPDGAATRWPTASHVTSSVNGSVTTANYDRQSDIAFVLEFTDICRTDVGKLTGRCGCCGKTLTDPDYKMRGIGPECIKGLR